MTAGIASALKQKINDPGRWRLAEKGPGLRGWIQTNPSRAALSLGTKISHDPPEKIKGKHRIKTDYA